MKRAVLRLICRFVGHDYREFCDGLKSQCNRCAREEWVMGRSYPLIGEAKYFWQCMDFDATVERRRAR